MYNPVVHKTSCILPFNLLNLCIQNAIHLQSQCLSFPRWICLNACKYLHWLYIAWYLITVSNQNERLVYLYIRYRNVRNVTLFPVILRTDKYKLQLKEFPFGARFQNCEERLFASSCLSVRLPVQNSSAPTGRIFVKFEVLIFFENPSRKFKCHWNTKRITGTLYKNQVTFFISRSVLLKMRNVSDKHCRENQNTHFTFNNSFWNSCHLWDNVEKYCRAGQATDDNMAHAHCMPDI
jgi:hypothetical protein